MTTALLLVATAAAQAPSTAHYRVHAMGSKSEAGAIPLEVELELRAPRTSRTVFEIPVWTPGSYRLRDFPERITPLDAKVDGVAAPIETLSRTAWQVSNGKAATVTFRYRVELRPNDRFMDPAETRRCLTYEGPAVYVYARGHLDAPCRVRFELPDGWSPTSGLDPAADGSFTASDYDVLADCPVKLGVFQKFGFDAGGAQVDVIVDADKDLEFDSKSWLAGLQAIVSEGAAIFGGMPTPHYAFLFSVTTVGGGGGLEHLTSTAIGLQRAGFVKNPASSFGVSAHEFFHLWDVKRLRPIELGPFRYDRPNRTTGLWLSEGVDSYYGELLQARAGLITADQFWRAMGRSIAALESTPGRRFTSSEQASLRVWDKQAPDRVVDYYGSGTVLGLLLDLEIRGATGNQKSLDDAMVALWQFCRDDGRGLSSEEIVQVASKATGVDLAEFFDKHVSGTVVPDYARCLGHAGLAYTPKPRNKTTVLRGLELGNKESPAFRDFAAIETSGGGDPLQLSGRVRSLDEQKVEDGDGARSLVDAAVAAGKTAMTVEYETATGSKRSVRAALEERGGIAVELAPIAEAPPAAVQLRESITRARAAK
jgi:predicted metalloprotease with PDZ domain